MGTLCMVPDWDMDTVHVSDLLPQQHPGIYLELQRILDENGIPLFLIQGTKDIWCRDYMPIQVSDDRYVQFRYEPSYLKGYRNLITPPRASVPSTRLNVDGGNVVASPGRVIMADRVYKENPHISRKDMREKLQSCFNAELVIIPTLSYDYVGHSDGITRFLDENTVVINDTCKAEAKYKEKVQATLEKQGLQVKTIPYEYVPLPKNKCPVDSAVGCYINYLRVRDVVILPAFDHPKDALAKTTVEKLLPSCKVYQVNATRLAEGGGVFNCITWNTREVKCQGHQCKRLRSLRSPPT